METLAPSAEPDAPSLTFAPLVIGLVAPVGADLNAYESALRSALDRYRRQVVTIRLSDLLDRVDAKGLGVTKDTSSEFRRLQSFMDLGDRLREHTGRNDVLARWAVAQIFEDRARRPKAEPIAYVVRSLKRPEEVTLLRSVYGAGFHLVGVQAGETQRRENLVHARRLSPVEAETVMERDRGESDEFGQQTRGTFELSDVFLPQRGQFDVTLGNLERFLRLCFGDPFVTPTPDEHAMFAAYAASLRSSDMSRQVGAVVCRPGVGIVSTGTNDVPVAGGGLYWPGEGDQRDFQRGHDANARRKNELIDGLVRVVLDELGVTPSEDHLSKLRTACRRTALQDITEFGRAVHAEMDAILACARAGISTHGAELFSTTFPCHNCAKHILAAGFRRVVYIEPYSKSLALRLHGDAIRSEESGSGDDSPDAVRFQPFEGVGPRRYFDLFSLRMGNGRPLRRKDSHGERVPWSESRAEVRSQFDGSSLAEREQMCIDTLRDDLQEP